MQQRRIRPESVDPLRCGKWLDPPWTVCHSLFFGALLPRTDSSASTVPRRRWRIAFLLALGVLVSFFDRINLSVSREALNISFGMSLIAFGYLSSAFSWTYALMQMPAGILLDRLGGGRGGGARTFAWGPGGFWGGVRS